MVKTFNTQHNMKRDDIIFDIIEKENQRQRKGIELIASENFVSDQVMQAMGSCLTNKYAEGYPGLRLPNISKYMPSGKESSLRINS